MLEAGLYSLLSGTGTLTALVGNRIYPVVLPLDEETYPAISFQAVSGSSQITLDSKNLDEKRIQVDAWGTTYGDSRTVIDQVKKLLHGYAGTLADGTRIVGCIAGVPMDIYEGEGRCYRSMLEFDIQYVEP